MTWQKNVLYTTGVACYLVFGLVTFSVFVLALHQQEYFKMSFSGTANLVSSDSVQNALPDVNLMVKYNTRNEVVHMTFFAMNFTVKSDHRIDKLVFPLEDKIPLDIYPIHDEAMPSSVVTRIHQDHLVTYFDMKSLSEKYLLVFKLKQNYTDGDFVQVKTLDIAYQIK